MKKWVLPILFALYVSLAYSYTYLSCPHNIASINIPCYINKPGTYNITSNIFFNPTVCFFNNTSFFECPFILINSSNVIINGNYHKISLRNIATGFFIVNKTNITIKNMEFVHISGTPFVVKNSKYISIVNITISQKNISNTTLLSFNSTLLLQNLSIENVNYPLIFFKSSFILFNSSLKYYQIAIKTINSNGIIYQSNITNGITGILINNSRIEIANTTISNNSNGIIFNSSKLVLINSYVCRNIYDVLLFNKSKNIQIKNSTIGSIFLRKNNISIKLNKTQVKKLLGWDFYTNNYCNMKVEKTKNRKNVKIRPSLTTMNAKIIINKKYKENKDLLKNVLVIIFIIIVVIIALYFMIFKKI